MFEKLARWHAKSKIDTPSDTWHAKLKHWQAVWHGGTLARKNEKLARFWHVNHTGTQARWHVNHAGTQAR